MGYCSCMRYCALHRMSVKAARLSGFDAASIDIRENNNSVPSIFGIDSNLFFLVATPTGPRLLEECFYQTAFFSAGCGERFFFDGTIPIRFGQLDTRGHAGHLINVPVAQTRPLTTSGVVIDSEVAGAAPRPSWLKWCSRPPVCELQAANRPTRNHCFHAKKTSASWPRYCSGQEIYFRPSVHRRHHWEPAATSTHPADQPACL